MGSLVFQFEPCLFGELIKISVVYIFLVLIVGRFSFIIQIFLRFRIFIFRLINEKNDINTIVFILIQQILKNKTNYNIVSLTRVS